MIQDGTPIIFVPCRDPARSRAFYEDTLGLEPVTEDEFAYTFDAGGTPLRLTRVAEHTPPDWTVAGWEVDDLEAALATLADRGVAAERFQGLDQDERGIWSAPDGTRVVWFRDPDGNVLSLTTVLE
ncbi:MAG TPA: VOC family protein [Longimicrobiales bacterium]|nr:VOC family protein [Longimicrobiales bacterium]